MELRPYYMAREWTRLGQKVTIAAASFSHLRRVAPKMSGIITEEAVDGIRYVWVKAPRYSGNGVGRAINMFVFVVRLLYHSARVVGRDVPTVVIASSTYPLDILPAFRIAKRSSAKLVFEVHDLWPLTPVELGGMSPLHPFIMLLRWAENFAYKRADRVISILPSARDYMMTRGMAAEKFAYVPNGIDVAEWERESGQLPQFHVKAFSELQRSRRFLVGYAGGHGISNALNVVLDAAEILRDSPINFVLVGEGAEKSALSRRAMDRKLTNVVFLPAVAKTSVPRLLAHMDALYLGWKDRNLYRYGISPNKLLDYMMAGKVVVHANSAANDPVKESGCGISIPPEDPSALAGAVRQILELAPSERDRMGKRGMNFVRANHEYRLLARRFLQHLV